MKRGLVILIISLRTAALIACITDSSLPRYLEVHNALSIVGWSASHCCLTLERTKGVTSHHWSLRSFWGGSLILAAFSLRLVVLPATMGLIGNSQVWLFGLSMTLNGILCVLAIVFRQAEKPVSDEPHYSSISLNLITTEESTDDENEDEVWLVEKKHRLDADFADNRVDDVTWELMKRICGYGGPELSLLLGGALIGLIASVIGMGKALFIGVLTNQLIAARTKAHAMQCLVEYIELMMIIYVMTASLNLVYRIMYAVAGQRITVRLKNNVFSAVLTQDMSFYDTTPPGAIMNRIVKDTAVIKRVIMNNLIEWVHPILKGAVSFAAIFFLSWRLSLVTLSLVPAMFAMTYVASKVNQFLTMKNLDALAECNAAAEEGINAIPTLRSFGTEPMEAGKYERLAYVSYDIKLTRGVINAWITQYQMLLSSTMRLGGVWYGGVLVVRGELSFGFLVSYFMFQGNALGSLSKIMGIFPKFAKGIGASKRLFSMMDRERSVPFCGGEKLEAMAGHIRFSNVSFRYPSRPTTTVLHDISLDVRPGECHALVGPSGSGKSTMIGLLQALYYPTGGSITIDGVEIRKLDPLWYRRRVGSVPQNPVLFNATLRDNLSYGTVATEGQITEAARKAGVLEFSHELDQGLDTVISGSGSGGGTLSGGQKQRIALARAILRDPRVVLLDEATSALDSKSEGYIQLAMGEFLSARSCVVIAHRLTTVIGADLIHVIKEGMVVETGSHRELMEGKGEYYAFAKRQFDIAEEDEEQIRDLPPEEIKTRLDQVHARVQEEALVVTEAIERCWKDEAHPRRLMSNNLSRQVAGVALVAQELRRRDAGARRDGRGRGRRMRARV